MVFPTFFNFSLNLAMRSSWSEPQSVPGLVIADYIELFHLWLQRISSIWFQGCVYYAIISMMCITDTKSPWVLDHKSSIYHRFIYELSKIMLQCKVWIKDRKREVFNFFYEKTTLIRISCIQLHQKLRSLMKYTRSIVFKTELTSIFRDILFCNIFLLVSPQNKLYRQRLTTFSNLKPRDVQ